MLDKQQINVICSIISIFPDLQKKARKVYKKFFLTFLKVPIKILKASRDKKKIYKNYFSKKIKNVVGIDIPFPKPYRPDLICNSYGKNTPLKIKNDICRKLRIDD